MYVVVNAMSRYPTFTMPRNQGTYRRGGRAGGSHDALTFPTFQEMCLLLSLVDIESHNSVAPWDVGATVSSKTTENDEETIYLLFQLFLLNDIRPSS